MIMRGRPASVFAKARVVMFVALAGSLLCAQTGRTSLRNKVAETPPMGWNSYDYYNWTVDEAETMANAEWMAKRLKPYGWQYVVVDFLWSMPLRKNTFSHRQWRRHGRPRFRLAMDADGRLLPDPGRFPSSAGGGGFRALAGRIHALGLKFGIHVMRGIPRQAVFEKTPVSGTPFTADEVADVKSICEWNDHMYGLDMAKPGAQAYLDSVFKLYASWGVDFVKVDDILSPFHREEIEGYRRAIDDSGRPMVLSLSCGPVDASEAGFLEANANMWRVTSDMWDSWAMLRDAFRSAEEWRGRSGAKAWPDLDMLPLGRIAARYNRDSDTFSTLDRNCRLTRDERQTLMNLWAICRSPLMIGANLPDNDEWTTSLLTNRAVIEVDQHSRNSRLVREGDLTVYAADAQEGEDVYVAFFNKTDAPATVSLNLAELSLNPNLRACTIEDLWTGKTLGRVENAIRVPLAPHASALYRLRVERSAPVKGVSIEAVGSQLKINKSVNSRGWFSRADRYFGGQKRV